MIVFVGVIAFMAGASFGVLAAGLCMASGLDQRDDEIQGEIMEDE